MGLEVGPRDGDRVGDADFVSVGFDDNEGDEVGPFVGELVVGDDVGGEGSFVGATVGERH